MEGMAGGRRGVAGRNVVVFGVWRGFREGVFCFLCICCVKRREGFGRTAKTC
ncbi:MAG: hypothetical protein RR137_03500 [Odoribacter sp.]